MHAPPAAAMSATRPEPPGARLVWWLVPLIAWNLIWSPYLPEGYASDTGVTSLLLMSEHLLRVATFVMIALLRERGSDRQRHAGRVLTTIGVALYFLSWIPLLWDPAAAQRPLLAVLPAATPALWLAALSWQARSAALAVLASAFLGVHIAHVVLTL